MSRISDQCNGPICSDSGLYFSFRSLFFSMLSSHLILSLNWTQFNSSYVIFISCHFVSDIFSLLVFVLSFRLSSGCLSMVYYQNPVALPWLFCYETSQSSCHILQKVNSRQFAHDFDTYLRATGYTVSMRRDFSPPNGASTWKSTWLPFFFSMI